MWTHKMGLLVETICIGDPGALEHAACGLGILIFTCINNDYRLFNVENGIISSPFP